MIHINTDLMFSSKNMNWETPQNLFDKLDSEFHFTLDVCATKETAKCKNYYTPEIDGLKQDWQGIVYMNPPYGRKLLKLWIKKAYEESLKGITVICLIPARTDTLYFHNYCMKAKEIRFIKGRLKFVGAKDPAPFPSAIIVFRNHTENLKVSTYIV
mgnify:CR=1 FL=1